MENVVISKQSKDYDEYEVFVPDFEFSEELNACACLCGLGSGGGSGTQN